MKFTRTRYQYGSVERRKRAKGGGVWVYRFRTQDADGARKHASVILGSFEKLPTKAMAEKAAEAYRLLANPDDVTRVPVHFSALVERYRRDELPKRHSTAKAYLANLRTHIEPKWGSYALEQIRPFAVERWLKELDLSPKTKHNIKSIMMTIFDCAARWEFLDPQGQNPMRLVRVPDGTKRKRAPRWLTVDEFRRLLDEIKGEPYRTMVIVAACLGLRLSELTGLKWGDFDFDHRTVHIVRAVVEGRIDATKTAGSEKVLPVDQALTDVLMRWRALTPWHEAGDWLFASPLTNGRTP